MKILIITIGTQGDARPFVALGKKIKNELGHQIVIGTSDDHKDLVEEAGLEHACIQSYSEKSNAQEHAKSETGNKLKAGRQMMKDLKQWMPVWVKQGLAAAQGAQLIIGSGSGSVLAMSLAEKLELPFVQVQFMPFEPSREMPPMWPNYPLKHRVPSWINLALGHFARLIVWRLQSGPASVIRNELSLEQFPWRGPWSMPSVKRDRKVLYSFSSHLLPQPSDWSREHIRITGSWFYAKAHEWEPPASLVDFLEAGKKPIYIGFGSMLTGDPKGFSEKFLEAIKSSGERAIVSTGWGALSADVFNEVNHPDILCIEGAPHDWLMPRMKLAVHHGGSGTCAAVARAGIPQVIIPFVADQFFWGYQIHKMNLGPDWVVKKDMTPSDITAAISDAQRADRVEQAQRIGAAVDGEDGLATAIDTLVEWNMIPSPK